MVLTGIGYVFVGLEFAHKTVYIKPLYTASFWLNILRLKPWNRSTAPKAAISLTPWLKPGACASLLGHNKDSNHSL
jgi:hypothetical protein